MRAAARQLRLTGWGLDRIFRVVRNRADLAGCPDIREAHPAEAVTWRPCGLADSVGLAGRF
nr:hypothetical protein [Deinococcus hopiensis]